MSQPLVFQVFNFSFGLPMSGKGLVGKQMEEIWGFKNWISRDQIKLRKSKSTPFLVLAEQHEREGTFIPDVPMIELFKNTFVLTDLVNMDGMPRNCRQAREVMAHITSLGVRKVDLIHLHMTPQESMKRFMKKFSAPDRAGRLDANPEVHEQRLKLHMEEEDKILNVLRRGQVRVHVIDALLPIPQKMLLIQNYLRLPQISDAKLEKLEMIEIQEKEGELQVV